MSFKDISDQLQKALSNLEGAKKVKEDAEAKVQTALAAREAASEAIKAVEAAVVELHAGLKAHVEGAVGIKHNG